LASKKGPENHQGLMGSIPKESDFKGLTQIITHLWYLTLGFLSRIMLSEGRRTNSPGERSVPIAKDKTRLFGMGSIVAGVSR
jgi:hypothetical protein